MIYNKFKKVQVDALFEAICKEGLEPYFLVNTDHPDVLVPPGYAKDNIIVLNLSASAVGGFGYDETGFIYSASFGGKKQNVVIPYEAIAAVYPKGKPELGFNFPVVIPEKPTLIKADYGVESNGFNPKANANWAKSSYVV